MPPSDVILVCLKSVLNHDVLPGLLRPLIHKGVTVVLIQNGIGLEEDLQAVFPGLSLEAELKLVCRGLLGHAHC
ncbi:MAG: hypothetical protein IJ151_09200 [Bacteroidales bacterium]|nr:hypothetical protein [Bacteroidales bacterium]